MPRPDRSGTVVFLPGFMASATSYGRLLDPIEAAGFHVLVPQLYRRGLATLLGRVSVAAEVQAAVETVATMDGPVVLGGHSRGGQAAWRAAGLAPVAGLILVDPVDGEGRPPSGPTSTKTAARFSCPSLIVGAGVAGPCAPAAVNYRQFAAATPAARLEVVDDMGHADILDGRARSLGRRLCGGGADPDRARARCAEILLDFVDGVLA